MDSIHLVPLVSGTPFSLANGRHHQEIGEKEKRERWNDITPDPFLPGSLPDWQCLPPSVGGSNSCSTAAGPSKVSSTPCFGPRVVVLSLLPDSRVFHHLFLVSHNPTVLAS